MKNEKEILSTLELLFHNKKISTIKKQNLNILKNWYYSVISNYKKIHLELKKDKHVEKFIEQKNQEKQNIIFPEILRKFLENKNKIKPILEKNINQTNQKILNFIETTTTTNNIISEFSTIYNLYSNDIYNLLNQIGILLSNKNNNISYNNFCPIEIKLEIERGFIYTYSYNYTYQKIKLNIIIHSNHKLSNKELLTVLTRSYFIPIYYQDTKPLIIEIYLTNIKKIKTTNDNYFGSKEINSGSTDGNKITIWRREEFLKLILHESIHYYQLDNSFKFILDERNLKQKIDCHFQTNNDSGYRIYETFTETLALLFNTMFLSNDFEYFLELLENEKKFSIFQTSKILKNLGITTFNDFIINTNDKNKCLELRIIKKNNQLNQKTSVLEYFILKTASIINLDKYIEYQINKGGNEFYISKKGIELNNIDVYYDMLHSIIIDNNNYFQKNVNMCLKLLMNHNIYHNIKKEHLETFRLTLF